MTFNISRKFPKFFSLYCDNLFKLNKNIKYYSTNIPHELFINTAPFSINESTVIVGGGSIAARCIEGIVSKSKENIKNDITILTTNPDEIEEFVDTLEIENLTVFIYNQTRSKTINYKSNLLLRYEKPQSLNIFNSIYGKNLNIRIIQITRKDGVDPAFMEEIDRKIFKLNPKKFRKILTIAVASADDKGNELTVLKPTIAPAQGLVNAVKKTGFTNPVALVNLSSTTAEVENFQNSYAKVRKKTDSMINQICENTPIKTITFRIDLVCDPTIKSKGSNHGLSYPVMLNQLPLHPVIETSNDVPAIQPVYINDLVTGILSDKVFSVKSHLSVIAAGPKSYTQKESYTLYKELYGIEPKIIELPKPIVNWFIRYCGFSQLLYGKDLLEHRDQTYHENHKFDISIFEDLIEKKLTPLEDAHRTIKDLESIHTMRGLGLIKNIGWNFLKAMKNADARREFFELSPYIAELSKQGFYSLIIKEPAHVNFITTDETFMS
ncbi:MAG: hypothetical protein FJZ57_01325 [Chlamydiae bacterium]|nr:hypothetical protein [Chlamydiota bacterium]